MRVKINLLGLIIVILFVSCKDKFNTVNDTEIKYRYYNLQSKGWKSISKNQKFDDLQFTATEVPLQYYILKETGSQDLIYTDSIYEEIKRERIIEFEFLQDQNKDILKKEFTGLNSENTIKYISFGIEKDFYVVTSKKDTIHCSGVNFERNYNITSPKILLFFTNIDPNEQLQLVYNDKLFNKGIMKFKFSENNTMILL
jgi:hypothetical protein